MDTLFCVTLPDLCLSDVCIVFQSGFFRIERSTCEIRCHNELHGLVFPKGGDLNCFVLETRFFVSHVNECDFIVLFPLNDRSTSFCLLRRIVSCHSSDLLYASLSRLDGRYIRVPRFILKQVILKSFNQKSSSAFEIRS